MRSLLKVKSNFEAERLRIEREELEHGMHWKITRCFRRYVQRLGDKRNKQKVRQTITFLHHMIEKKAEQTATGHMRQFLYEMSLCYDMKAIFRKYVIQVSKI